MANTARDAYIRLFQETLQEEGFLQLPKNGIEVWSGNIEAEWIDPETGQLEVSDHNVKIMIHQGFPHMPPLVFAADRELVKPSLHIDPEYKSLCLWTKQDGWQPYFGARDLIKRIKEWFSYYHTGEWPTNSEVPDLHAYLETIGTVVIGERWTPNLSEKRGRFVLWRQSKDKHNIFLASLATTAEGSFSSHETEERLSGRFFLQPKIKQEYPWFFVEKPFVPPQTLSDLLKIIDESQGSQEDTARRHIRSLLGEKTDRDGCVIALGYRDKQEQVRWLFLWAPFEQGKGGKRTKWSSAIMLEKTKLQSFRTAPAGSEAILRRTAHTTRSLKKKRVIVFGCGSLGSSIALLLTKAGLGHLTLVDHDVLMPGNVIRHAVGFGFVGVPKTYGLEQTILSHAPDCVIERQETTWDETTLCQYMEKADVVIDATANRNFSLLLSNICVQVGKPVLFVTCYRRAQIGRIIIRRSGDDPCLACYSDPSLWEEVKYPTIPRQKGVGFIEDGCGDVTEEAAAIDVEAVANLAARSAIKILRGEDLEGNLLVEVLEIQEDTVGILSQVGKTWINNQAHPECTICATLNQEDDDKTL